MVALLLALKQVLQGNHFSVMQDEKVALLQRLFLRKYNTQEFEGTSYVPRTSGRYILEETLRSVQGKRCIQRFTSRVGDHA